MYKFIIERYMLEELKTKILFVLFFIITLLAYRSGLTNTTPCFYMPIFGVFQISRYNDDSPDFDEYQLILPISKLKTTKQIFYATFYIIIVITFITILIETIYYFFISKNMIFAHNYLSLLIGSATATILFGLLQLFATILKSKFIFGLFILLINIHIHLPKKWLIGFSNTQIAVLLVSSLIIYYVSYKASITIVDKKEIHVGRALWTR